VMDEPVKERGRHGFVAEELCPGVEALVAGHDDGCALVEVRDEGKEEVRFVALDGRIADLVDAHEVRLREPREPREPELGAPGDVGAEEDLHEVRHALVADPEALVDGFVANGLGNMRFPDAGRVACEHQIAALVDKAAGGEAPDDLEREHCGIAIVVEGLDVKADLGFPLGSLSP
jgi:hypothetical protein